MPAREALAFDMYGTLIDTSSIKKHLEQWLPEQAEQITQQWRQKQLEFTFRLTAMQRYEDFNQVNQKALSYVLEAAGQRLDAGQKAQLIEHYNALEPYPDVQAGLERLHAAGHTLAVFSNGTPTMLNALLDNARLRPHFSEMISVDEVHSYKPAPIVYQHAARRLNRPIGEVRLISSNPFDVIGAQAAGMRAAWINRSGGLFDPLGPLPDVVVETLTELAERLASA